MMEFDPDEKISDEKLPKEVWDPRYLDKIRAKLEMEKELHSIEEDQRKTDSELKSLDEKIAK